MISQALIKDSNAVKRMGIEALTEKLGPIGMIEFMRQFDSGYGDYTKERHAWLDNVTVEEISNETKNMTDTFSYFLEECPCIGLRGFFINTQKEFHNDEN